jgi:thiamine-monophosphate kinase
MTSELELVEALRGLLPRAGGRLLAAAGDDDAAAWTRPDGGVTIATCDAMVEGVHFDLEWLAPYDVGWRAVAFALGDLAAKGARPAHALLAIAVGPRWTAEMVLELYRGAVAASDAFGLLIVGGDTTRSPATMVSLAALGDAVGDVIPRSAARPGWTVAVTGPLGGAQRALEAVARGESLPFDRDRAFRRPVPRLKIGQALALAGACCGDVSDGLLRELEKFTAAAGVGAEIAADRVPVADDCDLEAALTGGEEVELVCAAPADSLAAVAHPLHVVGRLTETAEVVLLDAAGGRLPLPARTGWDHFA